MKVALNNKTIIGYVHELIAEDQIAELLTFLKSYTEYKGKNYQAFYTLLHRRYRNYQNKKWSGISSESNLNIEISKIYTDVLEWLNENVDESECWDSDNDRIEDSSLVTLEELIDRIQYFLKAKSITQSTSLLAKLLRKSGHLLQIDAIKIDYDDISWKLNNDNFNIYEWEELTDGLVLRVKNIIESLSEGDLIEKWKTKYIDVITGIESADIMPHFALFSIVDKIQIPPNIELPSEKERFKRLMYLCQDAYQAREYRKAYEYCLEIRSDIEPESAQLYEYLMLSYFKTYGEQRIVKDALLGNDKYLKYLYVYSSRFKELQSRKDDKFIPKSATDNHNLSQIANGLIVEIFNTYSNIEYDYIFSTAPPTDAVINRVKQCLEYATDINRFIKPDESFADVIITELCGGSKFKWIDFDKNGQIIDLMDFRAITYLRNSKKIVEYGQKHLEEREELNKRQADRLLSLLRKRIIQVKKKKKVTKNETRERIYNLIISHRIATIIFPTDNRFCDFPISEFSEEVGTSCEWFHLNDSAELANLIYTDSDKKRDFLEICKFFYEKKNGAKEWSQFLNKLKVTARYKLLIQTNSTYSSIKNRVKNIRPESYIYNVNSSIPREVGRCIIKWYSCFLVSPTAKVAKLIFNEISGDSLYFYFLPINKKFNFLINDKYFKIESVLSVAAYLGIDEFSFKERISLNYFNNYLLKHYYKVIKHNTLSKFERSESTLKSAFKIYNEICNLQELGYISDRIYGFLFDEFVKEDNLCLIDYNGEKILTHEIASNIDVENVVTGRVLNIIFSNGGSVEMILDLIQENRKEEIDYIYDNSFDDKYKYNTHLDSRIEMVSLIKNCIYYFDIFNDEYFLRIPRKELINLDGKMKWYHQFPPFSWKIGAFFWIPHVRNRDVQSFSLKSLTREVMSRIATN